MPLIEINGANIFYEEYGSGEEVIVFSHGFFFTHKMYGDQIEELQKQYRIIAYDHRGQGQSEVTEGGYDIDNLTEDGRQLITKLKLEKVHFIGLSMGGFVGMRLAARYPDLIRSLILINTSSERTSGFKLFKFKVLKVISRFIGFKPLKGQIVSSLFGKSFRKDNSRKGIRKRWENAIVSRNREGMIKSFEGAILRPEFDEFDNIKAPTLVIGGREDVALSPEEAEALHHNIPHSEILLVDNAGHSSVIEEPHQVTVAIQKFLQNVKN